MASGRFISYLRVSTARQGQSGLGLEAQREAIDSYLNGGSWQLLGEYVEVESGKGGGDNRPKLRDALEACKRTGSTLLIAKLDRLSRNVAFISNLMESGVDFTACDFPQANRLTIHVLAAVAEHEREMISKRTKDALRAAKARGIRLGSPQNLTEEAARRGRVAGAAKRVTKADRFALWIAPTIRAHIDNGLSLKKTAEELNKAGVLTPRGKAGAWTHTAVKNALSRAERQRQDTP
jgi:DNA invertase Pin-like site-specific DNA recombinase